MIQTPFHELLTTITEDRIEKILASLVVQYRNGNLDPHAAKDGIGQIATLRLLPGDLAQRIRQQ